MKRYLSLICLILITSKAFAEEVPEKFKNPIFNNILWSENYNLTNHMRLTPNYTYDLENPRGNYKTTYIAESDKAVLVKYYGEGFAKNNVSYELYFIHEKYYLSREKRYRCNVWQCIFDIKNGVFNPKYDISQNIYSSDLPCPDEEERYTENTEAPRIDCLEELRRLGWDKYITSEEKRL